MVGIIKNSVLDCKRISTALSVYEKMCRMTVVKVEKMCKNCLVKVEKMCHTNLAVICEVLFDEKKCDR